MAVSLLAGALLLGSVGSAVPASAHAALIDSDPREGASLTTGPQRVSLTFSQAVQAGFSEVTVVGPNGTQWQAGEPVADGAVVSAPVRPLGPAGEYTIGYRVLSADSHPVQGSVRFTLTQPGPAVGNPPATNTPATNTPAGDATAGNGGIPVWQWLVGAGVLAVLGVAAALRVGRTR